MGILGGAFGQLGVHRKARSQPGAATFAPGSQLTFPPGGGPGGRQEQREAEAAAQPERGHGRACGAPSAAGGVAAWRLEPCGSCSALRCAFVFLDQVVLSTLPPDSVLTGREPVSGCDSPVNKEDPALRRQTNSTRQR